jgi:hypothetical protein
LTRTIAQSIPGNQNLGANENPTSSPMSPSLKTILIVAAVIAFLAIAYYFVIALPAQNKAKLQFERDKFEQELKEKSAKEQEERQKENQRAFEKENAQTKYQGCLLDAENHYNRGLEMNGTPTPGKKGEYTLPRDMLQHLDERQRQEEAGCRSEYDLALKAIEAK